MVPPCGRYCMCILLVNPRFQSLWGFVYIFLYILYIYGTSLVAQMVKNLPAMQKAWV